MNTFRHACAVHPNEQQATAIRYRGGHALVLAGAGTGKTFTVIERARALLAEGIDPKELCLMTFTRRAAGEMRVRIGPKKEGMFVGTTHSWCTQVMHKYPKLGVEAKSYTVIDRDDQLQAIRRIKTSLIEKGTAKQYPTPSEVLQIVSFGVSTDVPVRDYLEKFSDLDDRQRQFIVDCAKSYKTFKQKRRYMDYDDILLFTAEGFENQPQVAKDIGIRYKEIMVDEGQDLNHLQWRLLRAMAPHTRIFMVGDDAQSIYGFRGADFESIHRFDKVLPNANVLKLENNYRSTQEILDVSNWLLSQSKLRYNKRLHSVRGAGVKPVLRYFNTEFDEGDAIAQEIADGLNEGGSHDDYLVLSRNVMGLRTTETALLERKIPTKVIGGLQLFAASHTKDLVAALRVALNPRDELAWMRYLTMYEGIGDRSASRVCDAMMRVDNVSEAKQAVEAEYGARANELLAPLKVIGRSVQKPKDAVVEALKLLEPVFKHKYGADWSKRKRDMKLMEQLAARRSDVQDFIETYTLNPVDEHSRADRTPDAVVLSTIHSAKGTEAKHVYIVNCHAGTFPSSRATTDEEKEEERRTFYVALTRAKETLTLTSGAGGYAMYAASEDFFLADIPSELLDGDAIAVKNDLVFDVGNW